jgi:transcriptional regulator with XRE-family HTH domain
VHPGGESHESGDAFGTLLHAYRVSAGLSQENLAERAGLSPAAISALEHGRRRQPHPHTVSVLANALGLSPLERSRLQAALEPGSRRPPPQPQPRDLAPATGVPAPPTPLIGREAELESASALLDPRRGGVRLLTMLGPGGVGKTRLAMAVASSLATKYADGVVFADLSPLSDYRLGNSHACTRSGAP